MLIAKNNNNLKTFTVLNTYNLKQMLIKQQFTPELMFETEHWVIYRIFKYDATLQKDAIKDERLSQPYK